MQQRFPGAAAGATSHACCNFMKTSIKEYATEAQGKTEPQDQKDTARLTFRSLLALRKS